MLKSSYTLLLNDNMPRNAGQFTIKLYGFTPKLYYRVQPKFIIKLDNLNKCYCGIMKAYSWIFGTFERIAS